MARKTKGTKPKPKSKKNKTKRKLSDWNLFVMKIKKLNPGKSFGEVLKLASSEKKKGKMKV
jgi:hypothetical protein